MKVEILFYSLLSSQFLEQGLPQNRCPMNGVHDSIKFSDEDNEAQRSSVLDGGHRTRKYKGQDWNSACAHFPPSGDKRGSLSNHGSWPAGLGCGEAHPGSGVSPARSPELKQKPLFWRHW